MTRPTGEDGGLWQLALVKTDRDICSITDQQQMGIYQGQHMDLGRKALEARAAIALIPWSRSLK